MRLSVIFSLQGFCNCIITIKPSATTGTIEVSSKECPDDCREGLATYLGTSDARFILSINRSFSCLDVCTFDPLLNFPSSGVNAVTGQESGSSAR